MRGAESQAEMQSRGASQSAGPGVDSVSAGVCPAQTCSGSWLQMLEEDGQMTSSGMVYGTAKTLHCAAVP